MLTPGLVTEEMNEPPSGRWVRTDVTSGVTTGSQQAVDSLSSKRFSAQKKIGFHTYSASKTSCSRKGKDLPTAVDDGPSIPKILWRYVSPIMECANVAIPLWHIRLLYDIYRR